MLLQIITYDEITESLQTYSEFDVISDSPAYSHRGVMISTGDKYIKPNDIKSISKLCLVSPYCSPLMKWCDFCINWRVLRIICDYNHNAISIFPPQLTC